MTWVPNEAFSDEFNGAYLDDNKWYDYHPNWAGRPPARFKPEAVTVSDGTMKITNYMLPAAETVNGQTFTIAGGAVVSKSAEALYGYYECRMKASDISMSSTFWLINQYENSCPGAKTELDIQECIGGAKNVPSFRNTMHSNTHYYNRGCGEDEQTMSVGGNATVDGNVSDAFHIYGAYWENANSIHFYIDGEYRFTINPSTHYDGTPFDQPMYMNMVTETYDWETPPTAEELATLNATTEYDWVRSWSLAPTTEPTDEIGTADVARKLVPSTEYSVDVSYTASDTRDLSVELYGPNGWVGAKTVQVTAGSGCANVSLNLPNPTTVSDQYEWRIGLRPVGSTWQSNLDYKVVDGVSIEPTGFETISLQGGPAVVFTADSYTINVAYTAGASRDIVVELLKGGTWQASGLVTVAAGSNNASVPVNLPAATEVGDNYTWRAHLREVGGNWTTNVATDVVNDVSVRPVRVEGISFTDAPTEIESRNNYSVTVDYVAAGPRDIVVEFWSEERWIGGGQYAVAEAGSGSVDIGVYVANAPPPGTKYVWKTSIRPVGTTWRENLAGDQINDVRVLGELTERIKFVNPPAKVAPATSYDLHLRYEANTDRDLYVELWKGNTWIASSVVDAVAGARTIPVTLTLNDPPAPGTDYSWKTSIRPTGGTWQDNIATDQVDQVAVLDPAATSVTLANPPLSVLPATSYAVSVDYVSVGASDIVVSLWSADNRWLGGGTTTVPTGNGSATVNLALTAAPAVGEGYYWKAVIRPAGTDWTLDRDEDIVRDVAVTAGVDDAIGLDGLPGVLRPATSYTVSVPYGASQPRDIVVELWSATGWLAATRKTVAAGRGTEAFTLNLPSAPPVGDGYIWKVSIRPVGTTWRDNIILKELPNVLVRQEIVETVSFTNLQTTFSPALSYTVPVTYLAGEERDLMIEFWKANTWVAATRVTVPAGEATTDVTVNLTSLPAPGTDYVWKASIRPVGTTWRDNIFLTQIEGIGVTDNVPPLATCHPLTAFLDQTGTATIVAADIDGGSYDEYSPVTLAVDHDEFDCSQAGTEVSVALTVTDAAGNRSVCQAAVTVMDSIAPTITPQSSTVLWPPNNKLVYYGLEDMIADAQDNCGVTRNWIASVTSNEEASDGNPDILISDNGKSVHLRSARDGAGNGRQYTVTLAVSDASGNTAYTDYLVHVPHSANSGKATSTAAAQSRKLTDYGTPSTLAVFPNPATRRATIDLEVGKPTQVWLDVLNVSGQRVISVLDGVAVEHSTRIEFDLTASGGRQLTPGVYYLRMISADETQVIPLAVR